MACPKHDPINGHVSRREKQKKHKLMQKAKHLN
jgi:hypothetical protein